MAWWLYLQELHGFATQSFVAPTYAQDVEMFMENPETPKLSVDVSPAVR